MKYKKFKSIGKKAIIFMSLILCVSLLGVGYSRWNTDMGTIVNVTTGFLKPTFLLDEHKISFPDGELSLSLSDDGHTLYIEGEVYPEFNENILIKIVDEGSVPSVLDEVDEDDGDISALEFGKRDVENFELNICPENDTDAKQYKDYDTVDMGQQIENLKERIKSYKREENYRFEYILSFEQDI